MAKVSMLPGTLADVTIATAGTRQALSTTLEVSSVTIQWHPSNTGNVYVGDSSVAAARGLILNASNPSVTFAAEDSYADEDNIVIDLVNIYVDAANNGDKVKVAYTTKGPTSY